MSRGSARPSLERAKEGSSHSPIAMQIREGLEPYLNGMLKTIGQSGSGYLNKGKGDLKAALGGLKLLLDSLGNSGDTGLTNLMKAMLNKEDIELFNEEDFYDDELGDEEIEDINNALDEVYVEHIQE